jgi:hypothetical protein
MPNLQWDEIELRLSQLIPYKRNPRTVTESRFNKLKDSIITGGYSTRIKVNHENIIVGGHLRRMVLMDLWGPDALIKVLRRNVPMSAEELRIEVLRDNISAGDFDMDMLADDYDLEELRAIGVPEVMTMPPMEEKDEPKPKSYVKCPECSHVFPTKGNKAREDDAVG